MLYKTERSKPERNEIKKPPANFIKSTGLPVLSFVSDFFFSSLSFLFVVQIKKKKKINVNAMLVESVI